MERPIPGRHEVTAVGGEQVRAFIPAPLPPQPPLNLEGPLLRSLEAASLALGRLEGASQLLEPALFVYSYVRKEAVLSSQIEGNRSSLSDLLLFELDQAPGVSSRRRGRGLTLRCCLGTRPGTPWRELSPLEPSDP